MASKEAEAFLQQVREYQKQALGSATAVPTLEEMRFGAEAVMETVGAMPNGVEIEAVDVNGLSALWVRHPEADAQSEAVMWCKAPIRIAK